MNFWVSKQQWEQANHRLDFRKKLEYKPKIDTAWKSICVHRLKSSKNSIPKIKSNYLNETVFISIKVALQRVHSNLFYLEKKWCEGINFLLILTLWVIFFCAVVFFGWGSDFLFRSNLRSRFPFKICHKFSKI